MTSLCSAVFATSQIRTPMTFLLRLKKESTIGDNEFQEDRSEMTLLLRIPGSILLPETSNIKKSVGNNGEWYIYICLSNFFIMTEPNPQHRIILSYNSAYISNVECVLCLSINTFLHTPKLGSPVFINYVRVQVWHHQKTCNM
jgi:hypothetical protein